MENEINIIYELFKNRNHDDIVSHEEIEQLIHINRDNIDYYIIMSKVKEKLIPESKIIKAVPKIGYQILNNKQVSSFVYRTNIKSGKRHVDKAKKILDNLDTSDFNQDRQDEYDNLKELSGQLSNMFKNTIIKSKYYSRLDYYNHLKNKED